MQQSFDVVIIGAGPAAVAALSAAPSGGRICVVTGIVSPFIEENARVHPKIRAVAYERSEASGLSDFLPFDDGRGAGIFCTAALGGLANYWGQQFVRYQEGDAWPADIFDNYIDYERACSHVEAMFALSQVSENGWDDAAISERYIAHTPRLLVGTDEEPQSGLQAMRQAFQRLAASRKAQTTPLRATCWRTDGDGVCVMLSNGENVRGRRLILAAGVIGTLRLAMESCPELKAARFCDYNPYWLYTCGLDRILRVQRAGGYDHFNTLTIERIERSRCHLFASVYRMSRASLSLLLAAVGLPLCLRGWRVPPFVDLVKPVQVWTETSKVRYRLDRNSATSTKSEASEADADEELGAFVGCLKSRGVLLRIGAPEPGGGFHYHAADVTVDGVNFARLCHYIEGRFNGRAICVDASVLREIGCRPHTLTAMASAHKLSSLALQAL
jgi:choline dehydrogenase-like flavoprotein